MTDNALIAVNSQGTGDGGTIEITAKNLTLSNQSNISASTTSGEGSNLILNIADTVLLEQNSSLNATAAGTGNGGNMNFTTDFLIAKENSDITANAFEGRGGNINITAISIFTSRDSDITASSELGVDGVVNTDVLNEDPTEGLLDVAPQLADPNQLIAQNVCDLAVNSEFIITGRGGLPPSAYDILDAEAIKVDLVKPVITSLPLNPPENTNPESIIIEGKKLVPARGWIMLENGQALLVGYETNGLQRQPIDTFNCH